MVGLFDRHPAWNVVRFGGKDENDGLSLGGDGGSSVHGGFGFCAGLRTCCG